MFHVRGPALLMTVIDRLCKLHVCYLMFYQSFTFIRVCYCCMLYSKLKWVAVCPVSTYWPHGCRVASHSVYNNANVRHRPQGRPLGVGERGPRLGPYA